MNEPIIEPIIERTPLVIAAEINRIKQQTCKIMLTNAIEVGKRLKEAKALLPHGEWGKWLVESVSYSQRTANRLMIPEDEREKFILQHDVKDMTTRELDQALKERNQIAPEKEQAQVTPMPNNPQDIKIEYLTVKKTANPISGPKNPSSQAFTTEYEERCAAYCKTIADTFYELLTALGQLARIDPAVKEKCCKFASRLAENMVERLKEWPPVVKTNMTNVETYATHKKW